GAGFGVRILAVAAHIPGPIHRALHARSVDEDPVEYMAVGVVQPLVEPSRDEAVEERLARRERVVELRAAGVTLRAHLDLAGVGRPAARHRGRVAGPPPGPLDRGESGLHGLRLRGVQRARPVAGLAADVDLGTRRRETLLLRHVALLERGRVARRAAAVPVVHGARPMERVRRREREVRVEVKPALAALLGRTAVPRYPE